MRQSRFLPPAEVEVAEASDYFDLQRPGLGVRFQLEVELAVALVRDRPQMGRRLTESVRQFPVRNFPYVLIYVADDHEMVVVAVAHTIRNAQPDDANAVLSLMRQLAEHEGLSQYFVLDAETLRRCCFESPRRMELLVAEAEEAIVGYASLLVQFSPWAAGDYLFLDDLYVSESARGSGIGSLLMRQVGAMALERGLGVRWHVEHENQAAQRFYRALGADFRDKLIAYWPVESIRDQHDAVE